MITNLRNIAFAILFSLFASSPLSAANDGFGGFNNQLLDRLNIPRELPKICNITNSQKWTRDDWLKHWMVKKVPTASTALMVEFKAEDRISGLRALQ